MPPAVKIRVYILHENTLPVTFLSNSPSLPPKRIEFSGSLELHQQTPFLCNRWRGKLDISLTLFRILLNYRSNISQKKRGLSWVGVMTVAIKLPKAMIEIISLDTTVQLIAVFNSLFVLL
jgi:hypothetical protein